MHANLVVSKVLGDVLCSHLVLVDEQVECELVTLPVQDQIGEEERVELNVISSQVQEPSNIVQSCQ
jgi:hypothetical protein